MHTLSVLHEANYRLANYCLVTPHLENCVQLWAPNIREMLGVGPVEGHEDDHRIELEHLCCKDKLGEFGHGEEKALG